MGNKKSFDCVEMKYKIQEKMNKEFKNLSDEEIFSRLRMEEKNSQSPISQKWRQLEKKAVFAEK